MRWRFSIASSNTVVFLSHSVFCLNYPLSAVFTLSLLRPGFLCIYLFIFFCIFPPMVLLVRSSQRINVSQGGDPSQLVRVINVTLVDNINDRLLWVFSPSYWPVLYSVEELCNFNCEPEDHQSCIFSLTCDPTSSSVQGRYHHTCTMGMLFVPFSLSFLSPFHAFTFSHRLAII